MSSIPILIPDPEDGIMPPSLPSPPDIANVSSYEDNQIGGKWATSANEDSILWGRSIASFPQASSLYESFASKRSDPVQQAESTIRANTEPSINPEIRINGDTIDEVYSILPGNPKRSVCQFLHSELRKYALLARPILSF